MASTIAAVTTGGGGVITTADSSGDLSLLSGVNTVVAVTSTGATVTGTLSATGAVTASTTLAVTGAITATAGINTPNTFGFKNRIINGGMVIDQRNAGASITPATGNTYNVDRFLTYSSVTSKFTVQQLSASPPVGFNNYVGITSSSAYSISASDIFKFNQFIEGYNVADLSWGTANAKTVTLSFQVYSSLTGTFGGVIQNAAENRTYPFTYSIPVANTWTTISITIAGDTSGTWLTTNGIGMIVGWGLGVGSTYSGTAGSWSGSTYYSATGATSVVGTNGATFYITGVQLEKGSTATSFDFRDYGRELLLCQRYCEVWRFQTSSPTDRYSLGTGWSNAQQIYPLLVQKRGNPSVSLQGSVELRDGNNGACPITTAVASYMSILFTSTTSISGNVSTLRMPAGTGDAVIISAEL